MNIQSLHLVIDINNDGRYSAWELWEAIKFVYRLPGNLLVEAIGQIPPLSSALHIQASAATGYASLNGLLSVTLTLIFWVIVVFGLLTLASPEADQDKDYDTGSDQFHDDRSIAYGVAHAENETPSPHAARIAAKRRHHPVSRAVYAASGRKPKRHPWHHLASSWFKQAKP